MLSTVSGIQERHNIHELLFMEEVTGLNDLESKVTRCPDVSKWRGHVGSEFKRTNVQAASWGPGSRATGVLELGAGYRGPRALGVAAAAVAATTAGGGEVLSLVGR